MKQSYQGFCPLHEWERAECDGACDALRGEMHRLTKGLHSVWGDRRRGFTIRNPALHQWNKGRKVA